MHESLRWEREASTLLLKGELDRDTLMCLWQQRETLIKDVDTIDVAALERVDSSGLALLVHLRKSRGHRVLPSLYGHQRQTAFADNALQSATDYCFCG